MPSFKGASSKPKPASGDAFAMSDGEEETTGVLGDYVVVVSRCLFLLYRAVVSRCECFAACVLVCRGYLTSSFLTHMRALFFHLPSVSLGKRSAEKATLQVQA